MCSMSTLIIRIFVLQVYYLWQFNQYVTFTDEYSQLHYWVNMKFCFLLLDSYQIYSIVLYPLITASKRSVTLHCTCISC